MWERRTVLSVQQLMIILHFPSLNLCGIEIKLRPLTFTDSHRTVPMYYIMGEKFVLNYFNEYYPWTLCRFPGRDDSS